MKAKVRIAGDPQQLDRIITILKENAKQWGQRKIFRVKTYDRGEDLAKYHRTFGNRRYVAYVTMELKKNEKQS